MTVASDAVSPPDASSSLRDTTFDAGAAQLAAWCLLALVNQVLIAVRLPPAPPQLNAIHRAYDAGQLIALGVLSFAVVRLVQAARAKASLRLERVGRLLGPLLLAAGVFGVSLLIVGDDVANFAERSAITPILASLGASLVFSCLLTSSLLFAKIRHTWLRALPLIAGLGIAVVNALVLDGDYPAVHFMLGWLGALLIGQALQGFRRPRLGRSASVALLSLLSVAGAVALFVPPRSAVLQRLYSLSSAVVAPFTARFVPEQAAAALDKVPPAFRTSVWFKDRSGLEPVPATGAVKLAHRPIVIFLTIDAMRADVLEKPKYDKFLPELQELKKTAAYFTRAWAPSPATTTTMAAVFAGKYYSQLLWSEEGDSMVQCWDDTTRFPELLSDAGVRTVHTATLGRLQALQGVALGFSTEHYIPESKRRGADAVDKLIEEIDAAPEGPLFMYSHFIEPHAPYNLGGGSGSQFDRYVREIGVVDKQIGRLRRHLADKGLDGRTVLIVTADHGEAFGEHGTRFHAKTAYEELLHVPLMVYVPGVAGRVIDEPVTLMDVGPTVLDLFGLPTPGPFMAQSLLPLIAGKTAQLSRPIVADTGRRHQVLYFRDGKKVIMNQKQRTIEVYDLNADRGELSNLVESGDPSVEAAIETTKLFFQVHRRSGTGHAPSARAPVAAD